MKKLSRCLCLLLIGAMFCGLLTGCAVSESQKIQKLSGTWVTILPDSEENALFLLEAIELFEEEIALVDLTSLNEAIAVEFREDHTYRFAYDMDLLWECVYEFYQGAFSSLYENRTSLNQVYEMDFSTMSEGEFQQFYAEIYGFASFSELVTYMADIGYDYESLAEDLETGTYTIRGSEIFCTVTGETQEESLGYRIDGNQLLLIYADGTEYYTRKTEATKMQTQQEGTAA